MFLIPSATCDLNLLCLNFTGSSNSIFAPVLLFTGSECEVYFDCS